MDESYWFDPYESSGRMYFSTSTQFTNSQTMQNMSYDRKMINNIIITAILNVKKNDIRYIQLIIQTNK